MYIILAFLTPFALKFSAMDISNFKYFLILVLLYMLYESGLYFLSEYIADDLNQFFNTVIFVLFPYAVLYMYGIRLGLLTDKQIICVVICSFLLFLILSYVKYCDVGHFVPTQYFKYPPTIYYLSYAFFALNLIYLLCRNLPRLGGRVETVVVWLSSNSLWIYLWHIMALYLCSYTIGDNVNGFSGFLIKFIFILVFGVTMTYMQRLIILRFISKNHFVGRKIVSVLT